MLREEEKRRGERGEKKSNIYLSLAGGEQHAP
jgi:hypothetical protein